MRKLLSFIIILSCFTSVGQVPSFKSFINQDFTTNAFKIGGFWTTNTSYSEDSIDVAGAISNKYPNLPLIMLVNGSGIRLTPAENIVGGLAANAITNSTGVSAPVHSIVAGGYFNSIYGRGLTPSGNYSVVSGGQFNTISNSDSSVIGGGEINSIMGSLSSADRNFLGGGYNNLMTNSGFGVIAGGTANLIRGKGVTINANSIGGGDSNIITNGGGNTISGGVGNHINGVDYGSIGGGNLNEANGLYSTVPGGFANHAASNYTFAAGSQAQANHDGAFVWSDTAGVAYTSHSNDTFNAHVKQVFFDTGPFHISDLAAAGDAGVYVDSGGRLYRGAGTNVVGGDQVWTNDGTFIYPKGTGPVDPASFSTTPGPPIAIRKDGSVLSGTNANQTVDFTDYSFVYPWYSMSITDSNEPSKFNAHIGSVANIFSGQQTTFDILGLSHKDHPDLLVTFGASGTNGDLAGANFGVVLDDTSWDTAGTKIFLTSSNISRFAAWGNGGLWWSGNGTNAGSIFSVNGIPYTWPATNATDGQVLAIAEPMRQLYWTNVSSGGGFTGDPTQLGGPPNGTNIIQGALLTNIVLQSTGAVQLYPDSSIRINILAGNTNGSIISVTNGNAANGLLFHLFSTNSDQRQGTLRMQGKVDVTNVTATLSRVIVTGTNVAVTNGGASHWASYGNSATNTGTNVTVYNGIAAFDSTDGINAGTVTGFRRDASIGSDAVEWVRPDGTQPTSIRSGSLFCANRSESWGGFWIGTNSTAYMVISGKEVDAASENRHFANNIVITNHFAAGTNALAGVGVTPSETYNTNYHTFALPGNAVGWTILGDTGQGTNYVNMAMIVSQNSGDQTNRTEIRADSINQTNRATGNYITGTNGQLVVSGPGTNYFGANINVNGTVNTTGITNSGNIIVQGTAVFGTNQIHGSNVVQFALPGNRAAWELVGVTAGTGSNYVNVPMFSTSITNSGITRINGLLDTHGQVWVNGGTLVMQSQDIIENGNNKWALIQGAASINGLTLATGNGIHFSSTSSYAGTKDADLVRGTISEIVFTNTSAATSYSDASMRGTKTYATNFYANLNTAGYTNSSVAPGIGGTNNMVVNVIGTSGTLEFYNRSGAGGQTVCGQGVFTNTIATSVWNIPVPVNSGFIIRSPVGVVMQAYAQ